MNGHGQLQLSLLDQVPLAVVITTPDGLVAYWNRSAERLYGWPKRDVMRRPLDALAAADRAAETLREAVQAVAAGDLWAGRVSLRHRGGDPLAADVRCSPLRNAGDDTIGVILVAVEAASGARPGVADAARVGRRIARARKEAGLTQQELADRIGVTRRSIQAYESGSIAAYRHLGRLADVLGRTRQWFVAERSTDGERRRLSVELKAELRGLIREELLEALGRVEVAGGGRSIPAAALRPDVEDGRVPPLEVSAGR